MKFTWQYKRYHLVSNHDEPVYYRGHSDITQEVIVADNKGDIHRVPFEEVIEFNLFENESGDL